MRTPSIDSQQQQQQQPWPAHHRCFRKPENWASQVCWIWENMGWMGWLMRWWWSHVKAEGRP